jgi:hypothetical protein
MREQWRTIRLRRLGKWDLLKVEIYYHYRIARRKYLISPQIVKIALIHAPLTFISLMFFPPANETPPVAIPVVWLLSLAASFILTNAVCVKKSRAINLI